MSDTDPTLPSTLRGSAARVDLVIAHLVEVQSTLITTQIGAGLFWSGGAAATWRDSMHDMSRDVLGAARALGELSQALRGAALTAERRLAVEAHMRQVAAARAAAAKQAAAAAAAKAAKRS